MHVEARYGGMSLSSGTGSEADLYHPRDHSATQANTAVDNKDAVRVYLRSLQKEERDLLKTYFGIGRRPKLMKEIAKSQGRWQHYVGKDIDGALKKLFRSTRSEQQA